MPYLFLALPFVLLPVWLSVRNGLRPLSVLADAIARRDLPAIQGAVLFLSAAFVLVNLLTDVAYAKADPRVSYR